MTIDPLDEQTALMFLAEADMEVLGLIPYASNATLLSRLRLGDEEALGVYKPRRGERPLWDFESGTLCLREAATWALSHELGWNLVPPTVLRDGPAGFGAVQLYIEEDEEADVRRLPETHPDDLMRLSLFDAVINNADRKAGHLIVDTRGKLWGIDHGVCFSDDPKLRTVIWVYEGRPIPEPLLRDMETFTGTGFASSAVNDLLTTEELDALCERISTLLATRTYPRPDPGRHHVPWPPW